MEEKTALLDEITGRYSTASPEVIVSALNADGGALVETFVTIPVETQHVNIHKAVLLSAMTAQERAALRAVLAADEDFRMLYEAADEFTINHPTTIAMIDSLVSSIGLRQDAATAILRLGQRKLSRAEELIGRKITIEDVEEARS